MLDRLTDREKTIQNIIFGITCVIAAESTLLTAGRLFSIGPLSFRMMMMGIAVLLVIPFVVGNIKVLLKNRICFFVMLFGVVLIANFVRAIFLKQEIFFAVHKLKGCLYMLWLPILLYVVRTRRHIELLLHIISICATILSVVAITVSIVTVHMPQIAESVWRFFLDSNLGMYYMVTSHISRMLLFGAVSQFAACAFCGYFYLMYPQKHKWYSWMAGINLVGLLMTYTRGIYLGTAVAAVGMVLFFVVAGKEIRKKLAGYVSSTVGIFMVTAILVGCINGHDILGYGVLRITTGTPLAPVGQTIYQITDGSFEWKPDKVDPNVPVNPDVSVEAPDTSIVPPTKPEKDPNQDELNLIEADIEKAEVSADIRSTMNQLLKELILKNPVFGNGLGAHIDLRDGLVEMEWHDLLSKIGIVGTLLFAAPMILMLWRLVLQARKVRKEEKINPLYLMRTALVVSELGIMAATYTNPYMLGSMGLLIYCLAMRVFCTEDFAIEGLSEND